MILFLSVNFLLPFFIYLPSFFTFLFPSFFPPILPSSLLLSLFISYLFFFKSLFRSFFFFPSLLPFLFFPSFFPLFLHYFLLFFLFVVTLFIMFPSFIHTFFPSFFSYFRFALLSSFLLYFPPFFPFSLFLSFHFLLPSFLRSPLPAFHHQSVCPLIKTQWPCSTKLGDSAYRCCWGNLHGRVNSISPQTAQAITQLTIDARKFIYLKREKILLPRLNVSVVRFFPQTFLRPLIALTTRPIQFLNL